MTTFGSAGRVDEARLREKNKWMFGMPSATGIALGAGNFRESPAKMDCASPRALSGCPRNRTA